MKTSRYKRIQHVCLDLVRKYMLSGRFPKASGNCVDCGTKDFLIWEHRDYNDPFNVVPVCHSCNAKRGQAKAEVLCVETLTWIAA